MTLEKICEMGLVKDDTEIVICGNLAELLERGNRYQKRILAYMKEEIDFFTWQDNNKIYIDLKFY